MGYLGFVTMTTMLITNRAILEFLKKPIVNSDYKIITHEYDSGSRKQRNKSYMHIFLKRFHFT